MNADEELQKAQFFYNFTDKIHQIIHNSQDRLYDKIKDKTSIITAIIPILFGLGYFCLNNITFRGLLIPIGISLICFGTSLFIGFYVLWFNQFVYVDPFDLINKYHDQDINFITLKTVSTWAYIINENKEHHNERARQYKYMLMCIGFGLINLIFTFWLVIITFMMKKV